ncbi:hypothetical protein PN836_008820 [Ningiella sp. W23]|uniref:hypothetical protein n=1 Tax=Ningiella sp. W23 TaxID=3023715 RepID=UPI003756CE35
MTRTVSKNQTLKTFNSNFFNEYGFIPFPFFESQSEENLLRTVLNNGFDIWGFDQEYLSSQVFTVPFVLGKTAKPEDIEIMQRSLEKHLKNLRSNPEYYMFEQLLSDRNLMDL